MRWLVVFVTRAGHALMSEIKGEWCVSDALEACLEQYGRPRHVVFAQAIPWPHGCATMEEAADVWAREWGSKIVLSAWDQLRIA